MLILSVLLLKNLEISICPRDFANSSGVFSKYSAIGSAPCSTNSLTIERLPDSIASWIGLEKYHKC